VAAAVTGAEVRGWEVPEVMVVSLPIPPLPVPLISREKRKVGRRLIILMSLPAGLLRAKAKANRKRKAWGSESVPPGIFKK